MVRTLRMLLTIGLLSGCSVLAPSMGKRVSTQDTFAMVGTDQHTDQNLITMFDQTNAIVIRGGAGGEVDGMIDTLHYLDQHPEKLVVVDGPCFSACTLLLSRPKNVSFTENASFYFHAARLEWRDSDGKVVRWEISFAGNEKMMSVFDGQDGIQQWIYNNDAFASREFVGMNNAAARKISPNMYMKAKYIPKKG